ncbi:MAG: glycoside hydrolase family 127 protein [Clostridia bacterium]|nr:glycoside hydrolase family 127 protein [Clostridia bacterium]
MLKNDVFNCIDGKFSFGGYIGELEKYLVDNHVTNADVWKLFVNQFRNHTDGDGKWRGEYWGKAMRGAAMLYKATKDPAIYKAMKDTIEDLLTTQEDNGRISAYPLDKEFQSWDMWARKYILLGNLYFYEICEDEPFKEKLLKALMAHADYIVAHVGDGEGQIPIFRTSDAWGTMNSCSNLEPFVKLYKLTKKPEYLAFSEYIVSTGLCEGVNLIEAALQGIPPHEYAVTKAYEMMSCFQGLLEFYTVTGNPKHLEAVIKFADLVYDNEVTIIGTAGYEGEFFSHGAPGQTEYSEQEVLETCVTVVWMNLLFRLLELTGDAKYADWIECASLNALNGSVNTKNQLSVRSENWDPRYVSLDLPMEQWPKYKGKRQVLPFDSYSPLVNARRGQLIAGFNIMEDEQIYGCCACIGVAGIAMEQLFAVMETSDGYAVNLYEDVSVSTKDGDITIALDKESLSVKMTVDCSRPIALKLRVPTWSPSAKIFVDGKRKCGIKAKDGYWTVKVEKSVVEIFFDSAVKVVELNGKVAFKKGPYVLARDQKLGEDIAAPIRLKEGSAVVSPFKNDVFDCDYAYKLQTKDGEISLCDYAHVGKEYDTEDCNIGVWFEQ